jgi:hypothetical protein
MYERQAVCQVGNFQIGERTVKFSVTLFILDQFVTPKMSKLRSVLQCDKPVIPESPQMAKLGYGTGNFVFQ